LGRNDRPPRHHSPDALNGPGASNDPPCRSGPVDNALPHLGNRPYRLDLWTAVGCCLCDLHATGADKCATASAGAQFSQGHPNRHIIHPMFARPPGSQS
jgi:hypothetical protein